MPSRKFQQVLTLIVALEEINHNSNLLPNMSLQLHSMSESCTSFTSMENEYKLPNFMRDSSNYICEQEACHIVFTGPSSEASARLGPIMQLFGRPQISYGPFHPTLSDKVKFPYLYQVAPKKTSLPLAMVSLMLHFSWTWVGLIISDDVQGHEFLFNFRTEIQRKGICLAFVHMIPEGTAIYEKIKMYSKQTLTTSANAIVINGEINNFLELNLIALAHSGRRKIWITTSQWEVPTSKGDFIHNSFHGSFLFSHYHGEISNFNTFIQAMKISKYPEHIYSQMLGWMYFNCSRSTYYCKTLNNCSSKPSLEWLPRHRFDMAMNDECYNIYNAVYTVAHALHEMTLQRVDSQSIGDGFVKDRSCMQIHAFLKNIQFINPIGDIVTMNQKALLNDDYDIHIVWNFLRNLDLRVKIGQFSPSSPHDHHLHLYEDMLTWAIGSTQIPPSVCSVACSPGFKKSHYEGIAVCCFDCNQCPKNEISNETDSEHCVKCLEDQYSNIEQTQCLQKSVTFLAYEDPLGMALAFLALCFSALTVLVLGVFWKHKDTPIVKANNRTLSYILLISLTFCFLCSFLFIGHPNTATCILQQITFGVLFTVAVSTVLAKTVTVVLAFKVTAPGRRMRALVESGAPNFIIPICTLIQLILCAVWLGTSPPFIDTDAHSEHGHIIIFCNKGSVTAFYCVLGYLGSLALVSFTVAFLARKLPDTFNEAKFLTFSMLVFLSVWITFLPVYQSSKGKFLVAVEVFSVLASSAGLLGCIFVPKCYIILLYPDRNSLYRFRDKGNK